MKKNNGFIPLITVSIVLAIGFLNLYRNQQDYLNRIDGYYSSTPQYSVNLDSGTDSVSLAGLLKRGNYVFSDKDAEFIAGHIVSVLRENYTQTGFKLFSSPANLGDLNKKRFFIRTSDIPHDAVWLQDRAAASTERLGISHETDSLSLLELPSSLTLPGGDRKIVIEVCSNDTSAGTAGILIRLKGHSWCKTAASGYDAESIEAKDSIIGYAMTGKNGTAEFIVPSHDSNGNELFYSVVPVKRGYEYGTSKGTAVYRNPDKPLRFTQKPHMISPLSSSAYSRIKADSALTVRTPSQYREFLWLSFSLFIILWFAAFICISLCDLKHRRKSDSLLPALLMIITGINLLTMFSIANPLMDTLLGWKMLLGDFLGIIGLTITSSVNWTNFYNDRLSVPFDFILDILDWIGKSTADKLEPFKSNRSDTSAWKIVRYYLVAVIAVLLIPASWIVRVIASIFTPMKNKGVSFKGFGYFLAAMLLVLLLGLFGTGPEGSDAKVNLGFFQPSELSKFLIVICTAAFFSENSELLQLYSEHVMMSWKKQFGIAVPILAVIVFVLFTYLIILSDLGPALVLLVTFILMYSIAKGDFRMLLLGTLTYAIVLIIAGRLGGSTLIYLSFSLLWALAWIVINLLISHKLFESAIFLNVVIAFFLFGGQLLTSLGMSEGKRLTDRIEISGNGIWNNDVEGGDQVVQGIWSLASGGLTGQGLGKGNPNLVPAFNTDMILSSIGEEMGFFMLVLIFICYAILIHRSMLLGRRAGHPFAFFLLCGTAIVTGVQFAVISLGSLGIIPLTGVAVPMMSYGLTSLVVNLAMFGTVISVSRTTATANQSKAIDHYTHTIAAGSGTVYALSLFTICILFKYQFIERDEVLIRPARITNTEGSMISEYNPRIAVLERNMKSGIIYDRNGLILATSDRSSLSEKEIARITGAGVDEHAVRMEMAGHHDRFYPFGQYMFFMVGDYNTKTLWNNRETDPYGYLAESRHLDYLRGFDNRPTVRTEQFSKRISDSYLPAIEMNVVQNVTEYDYSELLPLLKDGTDGKKLHKFNEQSNTRDIVLTVDAALQTNLENRMAEYAENQNFSKLTRMSAVILDAAGGDLLSSAVYPLPEQSRITAMLNDKEHPYYSDNSADFTAFTDRDLGTTFYTFPGSTAKIMSSMAGFRKLGSALDDVSYYIYEEEAIDRNGNRILDPVGNVSLSTAIIESSNCYFIKLVNDRNLYDELDEIYWNSGISIDNQVPYYFYSNITGNREKYDTSVKSKEMSAIESYNRYQASGLRKNMRRAEWYWAWGQEIEATPLVMARIAAAVVNDGNMPCTRFLLDDECRSIRLIDEDEASILRRHMIGQKTTKAGRRQNLLAYGSVGGKTGTPERGLGGTGGSEKNDAWYILFVGKENSTTESPLAVAVRIERTVKNSGLAMQFCNDVVMPALAECGYITVADKQGH